MNMRPRDSATAGSSSPDAGVHALPMFSTPRVTDDMNDGWSDSDDDEFNFTGEYTGKFKILQVPTKVDPPTSPRTECWGRPVSPFPYSAKMERSSPLLGVAQDDEDEDVVDAMMACDMWEVATEPPPSDVDPSPPPSVTEDEFSDLDFPDTFFQVAQPADPGGDDSSEGEDDVEGEDIVKITSEDPKAAARAAAILRMHDYDCILAAEKKKRSGRFAKPKRNRRKTIEHAGISKSYMASSSQQWKAFQHCETSPGSRSLPLLELWRDAEDSVFLDHQSMSHCDASFTLSPLKAMMTPTRPVLPPPGGDWNRDCWKCLDKCFVAERLAVGASRGLGTDLLADVGDISKDAVLDRFTNQLGGEFVLASLGSEWSRDNLILRLDILIKKQSQRTTRAPVVTRQGALDTPEPRYRGLLEEAIALSQGVMALSETLERHPTSESVASDTTIVAEGHDVPKMFKFPDLGTFAEPNWQKYFSRGPIWTPSRTPEPTPPHPRDRVHLRHMSLPQKSMIPVPVRPKRLVDLRHLSPIKADSGPWRPTARRSSGCSVKELVRQFESLDK